MAATNKTSDQPSKPTFNLDEIEAEGNPAPMTFPYRGKQYQALGPEETYWRDLMENTQTALNEGRFDDALIAVLGKDQWKQLDEDKISAKAMITIVTRYFDHYESLFGSAGEGLASAGVSVGT